MEGRGVDQFVPDLLALIFNKVPVRQRLIMIPWVCKSWAEALTIPFSWQEIDLFPWTFRVMLGLPVPEPTERVVRDLVGRSSNLLLTLCVYGLESDSIFFFIAEHGRRLQTLRIPLSNISDPIVERIAARLSSVTFLDVSYCMEMGARGLQLIGNNCRHLRVLHRKMGFYSWDDFDDDEGPRNDEATAIASTMRNLKILDISGHSMSIVGIRIILRACSKLQILVLFGCRNVPLLDLVLTANRFPTLSVMGPEIGMYFNKLFFDPTDYPFTRGVPSPQIYLDEHSC